MDGCSGRDQHPRGGKQVLSGVQAAVQSQVQGALCTGVVQSNGMWCEQQSSQHWTGL